METQQGRCGYTYLSYQFFLYKTIIPNDIINLINAMWTSSRKWMDLLTKDENADFILELKRLVD